MCDPDWKPNDSNSGRSRARRSRLARQQWNPPDVTIHRNSDHFEDYDSFSYGPHAHPTSLFRVLARWEAVHQRVRRQSTRVWSFFYMPVMAGMMGIQDGEILQVMQRCAARRNHMRYRGPDVHVNWVAFAGRGNRARSTRFILVVLACCLRIRLPDRSDYAFYFQRSPELEISLFCLHLPCINDFMRCERMLDTFQRACDEYSANNENNARLVLAESRNYERENGYHARREEGIWALNIARNKALFRNSLRLRLADHQPLASTPDAEQSDHTEATMEAAPQASASTTTQPMLDGTVDDVVTSSCGDGHYQQPSTEPHSEMKEDTEERQGESAQAQGPLVAVPASFVFPPPRTGPIN